MSCYSLKEAIETVDHWRDLRKDMSTNEDDLLHPSPLYKLWTESIARQVFYCNISLAQFNSEGPTHSVLVRYRRDNASRIVFRQMIS